MDRARPGYRESGGYCAPLSDPQAPFSRLSHAASRGRVLSIASMLEGSLRRVAS